MLKWILGFASGVTSLLLVPSLISWPNLAILALLALGLLVFALKNFYYFAKHPQLSNKNKLLDSAQKLAIIGSGIACGILYSQIYSASRLAEQIPAPQNNNEHIIEARISSIPVFYEEYAQFFVQIESPVEELDNRKLKLKWYRNTDRPQLGENWRFLIKLKPIQGSLNQAGYDFERSLFIQQVDGVGYIKGQPKKLKNASDYSLDKVRQSLYDLLDGFNSKGVFQALILGVKTNISQQERNTFAHLGLNHLFAISGLHIAIIAGFGLLLGRFAWGFIPGFREKVSPLQAGLIISCFFALGYAALAGFSIPTQRACIMWILVALSQTFSQQIKIEQSLGAALLLVLLVSPLSILSASFWLTFCAVLVIALVFIGTVGRGHWFKTLLRLQVALSLCIGAIAMLWFQQFSLASFAVNLVAVPLFSLLLLPAIFISLLLQLLFDVEFGLVVLDSFFNRLLAAAHDLSHVTPYLSQHLVISNVVLVALICILISLFIPLSRFKYPLLISCLVITLSSKSTNKEESFKMEVLDVGHGLAVLIHNSSTAILYDTGFAKGEASAAQMYILPTLKKLGINKLDLLILSHADNDHAGGAKALLDNIPVKQLVAGTWWLHENSLNSAKYTYSNCLRGLSWSFSAEKSSEALHIDVLYPQAKGRFSKSNNSSCVVKVTSSGKSVLLAGDIEKEAELLVASDSQIAPLLRANILLAPHHGSKTSSSYPFIKTVAPQTVIYSTDRYNRYRMPHPTIKKRYQDFEVKALQTGCLGQVSYGFGLDSWHFIREQKRIWRQLPCLET